MTRPWHSYRPATPGSLPQRGPGSWQLRVCLGVDPDTGKERWATKTVHGSRRRATAQLHEFVGEAGHARLRAGTVADLRHRWLTNASPGWSRHTGMVQFRQRPSGEDGTASDVVMLWRLRRSTRKIAPSAIVVMRPEMITDASGKSASEVPTR